MHTHFYLTLVSSLLPALTLASSQDAGFAKVTKRSTPPGTHIIDLHRRAEFAIFTKPNGVFNPAVAKLDYARVDECVMPFFLPIRTALTPHAANSLWSAHSPISQPHAHLHADPQQHPVQP